MPLSILLPLVVVGIALIVGLIVLIRPTPALTLRSSTETLKIWNHRNPDNPAVEVRLNPTGSHALVLSKNGPGLVWSFGSDPVTRLFEKPVDCTETATGLKIKTHDFTAPLLHIPLPDVDQRRIWAKALRFET